MADQNLLYRGVDGQALAYKVLDLLREHDVPASPQNYEIWINHAAGHHPELSREIAAHIASGQPFDDATNEALFERFFANTRAMVDMAEANDSIARELSGVVSTLRDAGALTGSYAQTLQNAVLNMERGGESADLRGMMAGLAAATREMADSNRSLSVQMEQSSRQVEALQTALKDVKAEALTDSLTELANRRFFDENLRRRAAETDAAEAGLCLLMCDIDHFKRFNDTWGHQVGDQVIRFIASILRDHARGDQLAARYGGEEFAIVMPRTHLLQAREIGGRIHLAVKSKRLSRRSTNEVIGAVTVSMGIAQFRAGESVNDLIRRADACLYASKRSGRDRITIDNGAQVASAA